MESKTVKELKSICSLYGIKVSGTKAELIDRIKNYTGPGKKTSSSRSIRRVGCSKIDFLGSTRSTVRKDLLMTLKVAQNVADAKKHGSPETKEELSAYCSTRNWMTSSKRRNKPTVCRTIPLLETIAPGKRQYVFGRMSNLEPYYSCPSKFITLDSKDWDSLYQVNDMFVYCATNMTNEQFPLRLVFDANGGIQSRHDKTGFMNYDDNVVSIPHLFNPTKRVHILSREICQISKFFGMSLYQSQDYPHIFFASKRSPSRLKSALKRHNLKPVFIS
jgi:hypothetical protein